MKSNKSIEVRYAETDQLGVVYHANYLVWLEMGRTQLIKDLGYKHTILHADQEYLQRIICYYFKTGKEEVLNKYYECFDL